MCISDFFLNIRLNQNIYINLKLNFFNVLIILPGNQNSFNQLAIFSFEEYPKHKIGQAPNFKT